MEQVNTENIRNNAGSLAHKVGFESLGFFKVFLALPTRRCASRTLSGDFLSSKGDFKGESSTTAFIFLSSVTVLSSSLFGVWGGSSLVLGLGCGSAVSQAVTASSSVPS